MVRHFKKLKPSKVFIIKPKDWARVNGTNKFCRIEKIFKKKKGPKLVKLFFFGENLEKKIIFTKLSNITKIEKEQ